jgi:hypothetical protein
MRMITRRGTGLLAVLALTAVALLATSTPAQAEPPRQYETTYAVPR